MDKKIYDILIVGGGASGLLSSILIKDNNPNFNVIVIEKLNECGKKLSITGNGKCNITNTNALGYLEVVDKLNSLGIDTIVKDEGRVYPKDMNAIEVRNYLFNLAKKHGVIFKFNTTIDSIIKEDDIFNVNGIYSKKVIISTGGKSYPSLGTTGDGYVIARKLGHKINTLIPGLTAIKVEEDISYLKGVRQKGSATLILNDDEFSTEKGEIQFREDSISGICIMNLSNFIRKDDNAKILLDFKGYDRNIKIKSDEMILHVTGLYGWKDAQITNGGVELDEIYSNTFESKKVSGIYFIGEVLDISYKCGGFNLNNAWYNAICLAKNIR